VDFARDEPLSVTVTRISQETGRKVEREMKIVGVYFNVDPRNDVIGSTIKMMVNENFMKDFHVYQRQGDYSKILFNQACLQTGAKKLTAHFVSEQGFALEWYKNTVLSVIRENEVTIAKVADLVLYAALALVTFSVFMLYNYIAASISSKRKSVGVLRGLGASGKDVLLTFLSESIVIALINGVLAIVFAAVGCYLVNTYVMNVMNIFVAFALFEVRQILLILGVSLLTALLSSAIPIVKIAKKKPVELIR